MKQSIRYPRPDVAGTLPWHKVKTVTASDLSLRGYGSLVSAEHYKTFAPEIVTWPKAGGRPIDQDTGHQTVAIESICDLWWEGDMLCGRKDAGQEEHLLGWSASPAEADTARTRRETPQRVLLWQAHYHPDGGQLFFPLDGGAYVVTLALPGDDISPERFVNFYFDGTCGLYIHPGIWHEGVIPLAPKARFFEKHGPVHACVSVNFEQEFGCLLEVPLDGKEEVKSDYIDIE